MTEDASTLEELLVAKSAAEVAALPQRVLPPRSTRPGEWPAKAPPPTAPHRLSSNGPYVSGGKNRGRCLGLEACGPVRHTAACRPSDRGTTRVRAALPALLHIALGVVESSVLAGLLGLVHLAHGW
jgi:hypothetical protein